MKTKKEAEKLAHAKERRQSRNDTVSILFPVGKKKTSWHKSELTV